VLLPFPVSLPVSDIAKNNRVLWFTGLQSIFQLSLNSPQG